MVAYLMKVSFNNSSTATQRAASTMKTAKELLKLNTPISPVQSRFYSTLISRHCRLFWAFTAGTNVDGWNKRGGDRMEMPAGRRRQKVCH